MKTIKINLKWENKEPIEISAYAKKILREKKDYVTTAPFKSIFMSIWGYSLT
jgi:hypothetical protein